MPPPSPLQHVNPAASSLIKRMLHADPAQRPTIAELQADEFFTTGYVPTRLPTTCLTIPPRFSMGPSTAMELNQRRPLTAINNKGTYDAVKVCLWWAEDFLSFFL